MKNILLHTLLLIFCVSCGSNANRNVVAEDSPNIDTLNIEKFALDFYRSHRDLARNSITQNDAANEFREQFKEAVNKNDLLKGIPMNLRSLKDLHNGKCIAHFWSTNMERDWISPFDAVHFDLAVTLPKDIAVTLVEKTNYLLEVVYVGHIDAIDAFQMVIGYRDWVLTGSVGLTLKNKNLSEGTQSFDIDLGMMLVDFKDIKPYDIQ